MDNTQEIITHFNSFDVGVLIFIGLLAVVGLVSGFTRLVLMLSSWVGAGVVALYGFPHLKPYVSAYITNEFIAKVITGFAIFILSLIVFSLISRLISEVVKKSLLSGLDRSLGFLLGAGLGAVSAVVMFVFSSAVWHEPKERPKSIQSSKSFAYLMKGVMILDRLLPPEMITDKTIKVLAGTQTAEKSPEELAQSLSSPKPANPKAGGEESSIGTQKP